MRFASATDPVAFDASANATTLGAIAEAPSEVVVVDCQLVGRPDDAHTQALVGGELHPRCNASVMVELRRQDLVARLEVACGGPGEREVEGRHVHAERNLVRTAAEEAPAVVLRARKDRLDRAPGRIRSTEVA